MKKPALFDRGASRVYRGDHLQAIAFTVGGIGAGCIQMDGRAMPAIWQIFNNFKHAVVPNSFFAIRASRAGARPVVRALRTEPTGPFAAMKGLSFVGEYPLAQYRFEDPELPVKVTMDVFSPLVPMNLRDSGMPCAVFEITVENGGAEAVNVSLLGSQQNAVGYGGADEIRGRANKGYGFNDNQVLPVSGGLAVQMSARKPRNAQGWGDMALLGLGKNVRGCAEWTDITDLYKHFSDTGEVSDVQRSRTSPQGETVDCAISSGFVLEPGHKQTARFALSWRFPNAHHGGQEWDGEGNMYENWWPSALDLARELADRLESLSQQTHLYHDTLYSSNLPHWLLDRISSQVAIVRSKTCYWAKSGYFGGWEGCGAGWGCCQGNCSHVWHYAQAHARLFPELGRIMRDEELSKQTPNGGVPHRQVNNIGPAADGQLGTILESYREYLTSRDRKWLDSRWPNVRKAMDYIIATYDPDEDGVLAGNQWNTLDAELTGSTSWIGTLYLAALEACERMAVMQGDATSAARYTEIRQHGSDKQDRTLFNGEYYIQIPGSELKRDYITGCHVDQVLGQWWAHQLDLGWVYPPEHVRTALKSLLKYNFKPSLKGITQVPRKFVADEDSAMQMITWPKGGRPKPEQTMLYADEVMSGFEYAAAGAMVHAGLLEEGFTVVRAAFDRYDGRLRTGLTPGDTSNWGYTGNPFGDDECGKYYARAMSVWGLLIACQGLVYDGPAGVIGFKPVWKPEDHASFFTAAEGYGLFTQRRSKGEQTERLDVRHGKVEIKSMVFELPQGVTPSSVEVKVAGKPVPVTHSLEGTILQVGLSDITVVAARQSVDVRIR